MVKDATPVWISIPINIGRIADISDWNEQNNGNTSLLYSIGAAATIGAMGLWWVWSSRPSAKKMVPLVDPESQTRELPDGSRVCKYLKTDALMRFTHADAKTIYEGVRRGAHVSKNGPMLGVRNRQRDGEPYEWLSYGDALHRSALLARAIRSLGLSVGQQCFVGIFAKNRPEWVLVEQAVYAFNNVLVPLYETLGADASVYIVNQANIELVFCDTVAKVDGLLERKSACPSLKYIVLMAPAYDELTESTRDIAAQHGIKLFSFDNFERMGLHDEVASLSDVPPSPDDLATICYTSGTTGVPKGVMLTHGNIIADCTALGYFKNTQLNHHDVMFSFLPLAHMFERVMQTAVYCEGGSVGFFRGDIRLLADDIKTLRPTVLPVVPRVLNRIYDKVLVEANKSVFTRLLFDAAVGLKTRELNNWIVRNNSLLDQILFKKVREGLGGRVKLMITGSAPLSETVLTFMRCATGAVVCEGYGQTECVAAATITIEGDPVPGHVGVPVPCCAVKLIDVPELNYFAKHGAGEVCVKGPNVFRGYYKMAEQTAETLDTDGWLHTGDIGRWTEQGTLKIVDRKKHIFKLAQGEYVAPEKIELIYMRSKYVAQCFVHGESLKTCLVAVVVPDFDVLPEAAKKQLGIEEGKTMEELCRNEQVKAMVMEDIHEVGKKAGLFTFEQAKDIHLYAELFTVENELLTPTMKSKRPQLKAHFKDELCKMYEQLD
ncbi:hypothetical protein niasHS_000720 [Heterodera schachtii]|uniref:Long-chain-fatty-acid--CoA ligase n=1 Tax=Heterodera schachtii TaxID=97005 RepID=A0ABD2KB11_HETSC